VIELAGWGRYPRHTTDFVTDIGRATVSTSFNRVGAIPRGNGRAYGDAAVGEQTTVSTRGLDRMRSFDPVTGRLSVEAGVLLADILAAFVHRGWFPPVVPGTKFVTVGGMIATDVHGKNHHCQGGFGDHVESLELLLPDGRSVTCSATENEDLFSATIGGMGLTGLILEAAFRLRPIETGWMRQRTIVAPDLDSAISALQDTTSATYSVAWIDCLSRGPSLGRSLIYAAEHATREELGSLQPGSPLFPPARQGSLGVPLDLPSWTLNRFSVAAFNEVYFRHGKARGDAPRLVPWEPYFFPLDSIADWNRIYGSRGFVQHQCVIPADRARGALSEILERISSVGNASFLAVLKLLGHGHGMLSFPMEGFTLALDLPVSPATFRLLAEVDEVVAAAGGRLYLAKDARQSRAMFEGGYPGLASFRDIRRAIGSEGRVASRLSTRLGI
jgi:FAD/FMN-containing dehydrogenase